MRHISKKEYRMQHVRSPVQTETYAADQKFLMLFEFVQEICECAYDWGMWEVSYKLEETLDCIHSEKLRRNNGTYMFKSVRIGSIDSQSDLPPMNWSAQKTLVGRDCHEAAAS